MANAFISYSRHDSADFAMRLVLALKAKGQTVWIDKIDLPYAEKWSPEVFIGIDQADNFLFVISPESVKALRADGRPSPCSEEIARALQGNKRLIPVMSVDTRSSTFPESMKPINCIPFLETDNWDEALEKLIAALCTNIAWVHSHTEYLNRAQQWDSNARDTSYLLKGADLKAAEDWQIQPLNPGQLIKPTALQKEYITASREAETRSQKLKTRIATAVAIVSLVLAGTALLMFFRAKEQTRIAISQTHIAIAGRLAATAINLKGTQPDLASLLAVEATHMADTFDTRNILPTLFESNPTLHSYLHGDPKDGFINSIAFSPNGAQFATGTDEGNLRLWDATTLKVLWSHTSTQPSYIQQLAFNPVQPMLAVLDNTSLHVWQLGGAIPTPLDVQLQGMPSQPTSLAFTPDGSHLAVSGSNGIQIWDLITSKPLRSLTAAPAVWNIAFNPQALALLASTSSDGRIQIQDARTGVPTSHLPPVNPTQDGTRAIAFSPDGKWLAAGAGKGTVGLWHVDSGGSLALASMLPLGDNGFIMGLTFTPDSTGLAAASSHGILRQWDVKTQHVTSDAPRSLALDIHSLAFNPSGSLLFSGLDDGTILVWERTPRSTRELFAPDPTQPTTTQHNPIRIVRFSTDNHFLAALDYYGGITLWNLTNGNRDLILAPQPRHIDGLLDFIPGSDNLIVTQTGKTTVWDAQQKNWTTQVDGAASASISSTGLLATATPAGVRLVNRRQNGAVISLLDNPVDIKLVTFSTDGKLLAAAGDSDTSSRLWNLSTGNPVQVPLQGPAELIASQSFNRDGTLLAGVGYDGLSLWDTKTGQRVAVNLQQNRRTIEAAAFSPDGKRLAIALYAGAVQLADTEALRFIGSPLQPDLEEEGDGPSGIAFSLDGKLLAYGGDNGKVSLWDADPKSWEAHACRLANRNLTPAEWKRYIGETIPYHPTCPTK